MEIFGAKFVMFRCQEIPTAGVCCYIHAREKLLEHGGARPVRRKVSSGTHLIEPGKNPTHRSDPEVEGIADRASPPAAIKEKQLRLENKKENVGYCMGFLGLGQDVWDGLGVVFIFSISFNPFLLCFLISDYKF
jgi:hypothetical protein